MAYTKFGGSTNKNGGCRTPEKRPFPILTKVVHNLERGATINLTDFQFPATKCAENSRANFCSVVIGRLKISVAGAIPPYMFSSKGHRPNSKVLGAGARGKCAPVPRYFSIRLGCWAANAVCSWRKIFFIYFIFYSKLKISFQVNLLFYINFILLIN